MNKTCAIWVASWRSDPEARAIADNHYSRQSVGAEQFVPPGRCCVLKSKDRRAYWVTSWPFTEYVKHAWAGAWMCSAFRNQQSCGPDGVRLHASDMIRAAVACSLTAWDSLEVSHPRLAVEVHVRGSDGRAIGPRVPLPLGQVPQVRHYTIVMATFVDESKVATPKDHARAGQCFRLAGFVELGYTEGGLLALGLPVERLPDPREYEGKQTLLF